MKYKYLSNPYRSIIDNFLHLKEKYSNNEKQLDLIITDFFLRKIKDINEIFYQLEQCYNSTIKSPDFIEKFIGPISKIFEKKNVNNINFFENVLKEEFFIIILNDKFIKEIIQEIENRDLKNLEKIKNLIKSIKEESCIRHSNNCINNQNSKQIDKKLVLPLP
jgi:DNA integrity scanning protein DisA with diadenylate cyclase activity